MALATQCPHCHTTFRVAHDQLKLRAGLVRCGVCKQIFNGIENLLRPEEAEKAFPPVQQQAPSFEPTPPAVPADQFVPVPDAPSSPDKPLAEPTTETRQEDASASSPESPSPAEEETPEPKEEQKPSPDPLLRMTLMDIAPGRVATKAPESDARPERNTEDDLDKTINDLQEKPWRSEDAEASIDALDRVDEREYEEPEFVRQARRRQRIGRVMHVTIAIALPLLFLALLVQAAYAFRVQLAARFPEMRPALLRLCDTLHCEVELPTDIESVSIESNELQMGSTASGPLSLTLLLRNHSTTVQAWPSIELTLTDANEKPVARRVLIPRDYLPATQDREKGFAPKSEQPVKLFLELTGIKAEGYRVYLFYP